MTDPTPVADDQHATLADLHARANADYAAHQATTAQRSSRDEEHN
ncbi:hypothetical protein ABZ650_20480 [Streptomyces griseoviridis]